MDEFLEMYNLPGLNHEKTEDLNRPIARKEIKISNQKPPGEPGWLSRLGNQLIILAQIMISGFMRLSPMSGSALMSRSLLRILTLPPCSSPTHALTHASPPPSLKNKELKKKHLPGNKSLRTEGFIGEVSKYLKKNEYQSFPNSSKKTIEENTSQHVMRPTLP